jgi:hypothetical protein
VVGDAFGAAGGADSAVAPEGRRAAVGNRTQGGPLGAAQQVGDLIRRAMGADDVGQFDPLRPVGVGARGGGQHRATPQAGGSGRSRGEPVARMRPGVRWR